MSKNSMNQQEKLIQLAQSKLLSDLFDIIGVNYSIIDIKGNYLLQNNSAIKEVSGGLKNAKEIDLSTWEDCKRIMKLGEKEIKTELFKNKYMFSIKQPIMEKNKCMGIMALSIDVTKQKQAEIALQEALKKIEAANHAKSELLTIVNTEIRTPLNDVVGALDLLQHSPLEEKQHEYVDIARKSSLSIAPLLNYIQDYLNFESEKRPFFEEECSVKIIFEDILRQYAPESYRRQIEMLIHYSSDVPNMIITDSLRFYQVLTTFVANAIKFTHIGQIVLSAEILENKKKIKISVQDTGEGIPPERQAYLFNLFDPEAPHRQAGLRLSICRQMLRLYGGDAGVVSKPGKGSTFWFTLPFKLMTPKQLSAFQKHFTQIYEPLNVLIVDDNDRRAEIIAGYFPYKKVPFVKSNQALAALQQAAKKNHPFDVILIDQKISPVNLEEFVKSLEANLVFDKTSIIFLVYPDKEPEFKKKFNRQHRASYLLKPIFISSFLSEITRIHKECKKFVPKVLLVEDNLINQHVIKSMLEELGCSVEAVIHGYEALQKNEQGQYDIVFMDINLPDISGMEVTKKIRAFSQHKDLPIIAITAHISEDDMEKILEAGASQLNHKPIGIDALRKILNHHVFGYKKSGNRMI